MNHILSLLALLLPSFVNPATMCAGQRIELLPIPAWHPLIDTARDTKHEDSISTPGTDSLIRIQHGDTLNRAHHLAWLEGGTGPHGVSLGIGVRFSFIGFEWGGVTNGASSPPYYPYDGNPPAGGSAQAAYRDAAVGFDGLVYWDVGRFSFFGSIGYYEQTTKYFRISNVDGRYYTGFDPSTVQRWFAYGGGVHFFITPKFAIGAGYQSLRGASLLIGGWLSGY